MVIIGLNSFLNKLSILYILTELRLCVTLINTLNLSSRGKSYVDKIYQTFLYKKI